MKLAGESLGASAVGFVFSFRYVTIVIVTPIAAAIAKVNQSANGWMYFGLCAFALCSFMVTGIKVLKW